MSDLISRQAAIDIERNKTVDTNPMHTDRGCDGGCTYDEKLYKRIMQILDERIKPLPSAQPEEDCATCKHGYFGDRQCDNCRVRYPSHYEREEEHHGSY